MYISIIAGAWSCSLLYLLPEEGLSFKAETSQNKTGAGVSENFPRLLLLLRNKKEANHAGRYMSNIIFTLHPLVQSRIRTLQRQSLARQKSPILTAQTTRPLQVRLCTSGCMSEKNVWNIQFFSGWTDNLWAEAQRRLPSTDACSGSSTRAGEEETTIVLESSAKQLLEKEKQMWQSRYIEGRVLVQGQSLAGRRQEVTKTEKIDIQPELFAAVLSSSLSAKSRR